MHYSRSHDAVIRVYEHAGDFKEPGGYGGKQKSRHAVKHDGSLLRLVDRLTDDSKQFAVRVCSVQAVRSPFGFAMPALSGLQ